MFACCSGGWHERTRRGTVRQRGSAQKANDELLALAQHEFDAILTMDKRLEHQRNIADLGLIVVLDFRAIRPHTGEAAFVLLPADT